MTVLTLGMVVAPFLAGEVKEPKIEVASYYFGNYHPGEPINEAKGKGWSEWEW